MRETPEDLAGLQALLDGSLVAAGPHLRSMFGGSSALGAPALAERLTGIIEVHLAVVTGDGAPLVAPVDAQLFRGRLWFSLPAASVRTRLLRRDPRVSASYADGSFGLIVHGEARQVTPGSADEAAYTELVVDCYAAQLGEWWRDAFERRRRETPADADPGFTGWIEPRRMYAKG